MGRSREWNPLGELLTVQRRLNELFDAALARANFDAASPVDAWVPVCDTYRTSERIVVCVELPGLDASRIRVRFEGDELVVEGHREATASEPGLRFHRVERSYGRFARRFPLPGGVDRDAANADLSHGVLRIDLPFRAGAVGGRVQVPIG